MATPRQDLLEPWADQIYQWLTGDRLQMTRIQELLAVRGLQAVADLVGNDMQSWLMVRSWFVWLVTRGCG